MLKKILTTTFATTVIAGAFVTTPIQTVQAQNYIGEVRAMGYNFCPRGWLEANGALLPISQNSALFSLYGTTYGGDGRTTFGIPALRGRTIIGYGQGPGLQNYTWGQKAGAERIQLANEQLPYHQHVGGTHQHALAPHGHAATMRASSGAPATGDPLNNSLADWTGVTNAYAVGQANGDALASDSIQVADDAGGVSGDQTANNTGLTGAGQAFYFRSPYQAVKYCICHTDCIYPSRS